MMKKETLSLNDLNVKSFKTRDRIVGGGYTDVTYFCGDNSGYYGGTKYNPCFSPC
ncbi:hypothetical protein AB9P05_18580 [Roseivirga sp. BDSF3-8]|uniref:hypothetical protein n=1 Tax=Roseivirga sp. BDSF3-8 TaxID=3241598 RepID=UPI0035327CBF